MASAVPSPSESLAAQVSIILKVALLAANSERFLCEKEIELVPKHFNLKVPEPGESKILCENVRLADYCVSYGYKYIRNDGSSHTIQLNYRVIAADGSVLSHYPLLTFKIPELLDIIREAEIHGFVVQARSPTQQPTFFPGQLEIITLERT